MKSAVQKPLQQVYGRPRAAPGTVRIYRSGDARLSQDLAIASAFRLWVDAKRKLIYLKPYSRREDCEGRGGQVYATWQSNPQARSPLIALRSALRLLGMEPKQAAGTYRAVVRRNVVVIDLSR